MNSPANLIVALFYLSAVQRLGGVGTWALLGSPAIIVFVFELAPKPRGDASRRSAPTGTTAASGRTPLPSPSWNTIPRNRSPSLAVAGLIGIVVSFLLVGFIAVAGKPGSAPTLVLSRAAFGVQGNKLPAPVSLILNARWKVLGWLALGRAAIRRQEIASYTVGAPA